MSTGEFCTKIGCLCFALGLIVGIFVASLSDPRQAAIEAGVAHWTIDPISGERKFEYIKPKGDRK